MYTDTQRPNHLAQEAIDNSVDEAIAGFASRIDVTLHTDGSLRYVLDNGRGMPIDIHPEGGHHRRRGDPPQAARRGQVFQQGLPFSGGLHGVGVSVVNALSPLEVEIRRDGRNTTSALLTGAQGSDLEATGSVGQRNTGTFIRFWPNPTYFDTSVFHPSPAPHPAGQGRAVPGSYRNAFNG
jgi:topoisomerase-4 subunit B